LKNKKRKFVSFLKDPVNSCYSFRAKAPNTPFGKTPENTGRIILQIPCVVWIFFIFLHKTNLNKINYEKGNNAGGFDFMPDNFSEIPGE